MTTIAIGKYQITKVVELERPFAPAREFFPDLTADMLDICMRELPQGQFTADGYVNMSYHSFVVKTDKHTILVDTCCGNHKLRKTRPDFNNLNTNFMATLAGAGVKPEQVDLRDVHPSSLGPYRLEHAVDRRPLGSDVPERQAHHQPHRIRLLGQRL